MVHAVFTNSRFGRTFKIRQWPVLLQLAGQNTILHQLGFPGEDEPTVGPTQQKALTVPTTIGFPHQLALNNRII
jgi:hypothetical protein